VQEVRIVAGKARFVLEERERVASCRVVIGGEVEWHEEVPLGEESGPELLSHELDLMSLEEIYREAVGVVREALELEDAG
jgi:hypothetical protein